LVGIGSLAFDRVYGRAEVIDFVLSCRVFGRKLEESLFWVLEAAARAGGASVLTADYCPTPKNGPTLAILERLDLGRRPNSNQFVSLLSRERSFPDCVKLRWNNQVVLAQVDSAIGSAT
jgi:predicted enzyme involved in methoxymalonyl-ACP biosynthesis